MWAIEASPGPKVAYRGRWYHFTPGYTTERMNGNGELTEKENVFLRKLWNSYGILTDERDSYVLCYGNGYGKGYGTLETRRYLSHYTCNITY